MPLVLYLQFGDGRLTTRPVAEFSSPYISLYDLEQVPLGPYETIYRNNSGLNSENVARRSCSLLAPVWYEVSQDLDALQPGRKPSTFSPDPHGGEYTYSPSLDMTYFQTLPILARPVARAQLDSYRLVNLYWSYEEVDWPGTDFVILATADGGSGPGRPGGGIPVRRSGEAVRPPGPAHRPGIQIYIDGKKPGIRRAFPLT